MTMGRFASDFDRIFSDFQGFSRMIGAPTEDISAQKEVESGTHFRAAVPPPRPRYRQGHEEATNGGGND